jgi:outer membrane autotransporter protein
MPLGRGWFVEPQAQIIWQRVDLDDTSDEFSGIDYDAFNTWTGRLGLRLEGNTVVQNAPVQPYVDVNLWKNFDSKNSATFNDDTVTTQTGGTSLELGAGLSAQVTQDVGLYGGIRYTTDISGPERDGIGGTFGLRVKW